VLTIEPRQVAADLAEPTLVSFMDMARWIAAAMVLLAHLRAPLLMSFPRLPPEARTVWVRAWFFVTGFHGEAVIIFFVLSGFLVGGLAAARAQEGRFDPASYAVDRFSRLFIAFIPAVFLTLALDRLGSSLFGTTGIYDGTNPMIIEKVNGKVFVDYLGLPVLLGNLAMLQGYFVESLGSNEPLWTLSTEFWFYFVFGALLTAVLVRGARRWLLALAAIAATVALGGQFVMWFGIWVLGFIAACIRPGRTGPWIVPLALMFAWLTFIRINTDAISADRIWIYGVDYVLGALLCWLILAIRNRRLAILERIRRFNKFMADFSYSLYLIHHPVLMFLIAMLGTITGLKGFTGGFSPTDPIGWGIYLVLAPAIFALSWLFAQATERHTGQLRNWLKRRLLA
jgi:peptidoglycan/LPS O-acetylase OafA/YrhL